MPDQITHTPKHEIAAKFAGGINDAQFKLITDTIMKGATQEELAFFGQVCERTGLDPFRKQIHPVKRWSNEVQRHVWSFQVGIDGFRSIAESSTNYAGNDEPLFDDETKPHPNKATVTVWKMVKGQRCPFTASARYAEYVQVKKDQTPNMMWQKMPYVLLGKCAEALALRKAFPDKLSGVHSDEEMAQADNPPGTEPNKPSVTRFEHRTTPKDDPAPAQEVETEVVEEPQLFEVPPEVKKLIRGAWKDVEINGLPLGKHKVKEIHAMQTKPGMAQTSTATPLYAALIDEVRSILKAKGKTELELACADPEVFDEFPEQLWDNTDLYIPILELAKTL